MNILRKIKLIVPLTTVLTTGLLYSNEAFGQDDIILETDSLTPGQIAINSMTEEYKTLKEHQFNGEEESLFYPMVMDLYLTATKTLDIAEDETQTTQIKNVILDINGRLLSGAFYYSKTGNQRQLANFARAYVDSQRLPIFSEGDFTRDPRYYPSLVYVAASDAYNSGNNELAKEYFDLYLSTGEEKMRHQVSTFMGQACINTKDWLKGINTLSQAAVLYPDDYQLVAMGIQCCIDGGYADRIQPLLDRALLMKPGDEQLLNIQAQVYESNHDYKNALNIYSQIAERHPNSLENTQRIATCYFNLGVDFYNKSIMEEDEKIAKKNRRQSRAYFESATQYLEQIITTKPNDRQYLRALGIAYGCTDNKEKFDDINIRLGALGEKPMTMGEMPEIMAAPLAASGESTGTSSAITAPSYQDFAKAYIEERLGKWAQRGEFEKIEDYQRRVTEGGMQVEYEKLSEQAEIEYLKKYGFSFLLRDLELQPYDVTNETYMIKTPYGDATISVPLKNKEAEMFKNDWNNNNVEIRAPRYMIDNDHLAIATVTFKTTYGKTYAYDSSKAATYTRPMVKVDLNKFINIEGEKHEGQSSSNGEVTLIARTSDVDKDIPETGKKNTNTFAFVIANENYKNVANVASALHDGVTFAQYCEKTLGVPKSQIILLTDATSGDFWSEFENLCGRISNRKQNIDVILYYSGHGLPDNDTKEAYLLPIDARPQSIRTMIKLQEVYDGLGKLPNASVYAFMDACFSGSTRESGQKDSPIVAARGVALRHKEAEPEGNVFVLSATSAQQTAFPYEEKDHGLFTYWLLKKLQESKGSASLNEISTFVTENVSRTSQEINQRTQTPTHKASGKLIATWKTKKLRP